MSINNDEYELENPFGLETQSDFHSTRINTTVSLVLDISKNAENIRILDVGCGKGIITKYLKKNIPNAKIDAIDISEQAIKLAIMNNMGINFKRTDAMTFMGYGYHYDIILMNNIYEHVENPTGILINLKQLLTNSGVFIISTPNRFYIRNILRKLIGLRIVIPKYHITEYSIGQIIDHHRYSELKVKKMILPVFKRERFRLLEFIIFKIIQPLGDSYLKLLRSPTRLGSLLFIVSSK